MPCLEYLSLDLKLDQNFEMPEGDTAAGSTTLRRLESNFDKAAPFLSASDPLGSVSRFAEEWYASALEFTRLLYLLWPNVQLIARAHLYEDKVLDTTRAIGIINAHLSALARLNDGLDQGYVSFDSVDVMNKSSWAKCFP
ncbi:hypothetical protein BDV93DRAFT_523735 [Ceratobasidium sp. AG-I]|nr:hypothetical protein BDV93DRAFT_523735 [Ceratobasidium sp. AG-I]